MTLSFSTHINGKPTRFVEKIWRGLFTHHWDRVHFLAHQFHNARLERLGEPILCKAIEIGKIHTIRRDEKDRWQPGKKIHFVINNRTAQRFQFAPVLKVTAVQRIQINHRFGRASIEVLIDGKLFGQYHYGNDTPINYDGLQTLAKNDGFDDIEDFADWFQQDFDGKIIHWTDTKY